MRNWEIRDFSGTLLTPRSRTYALVLLRRSPAQASLPAVVLQQFYGLTPAEARLTADLAAGYSTTEIAERMRVTRGTLRSYLKRVFIKTGARRQAELITMVLNSPAIFARGSQKGDGVYLFVPSPRPSPLQGEREMVAGRFRADNVATKSGAEGPVPLPPYPAREP